MSGLAIALSAFWWTFVVVALGSVPAHGQAWLDNYQMQTQMRMMDLDHQQQMERQLRMQREQLWIERERLRLERERRGR